MGAYGLRIDVWTFDLSNKKSFFLQFSPKELQNWVKGKTKGYIQDPIRTGHSMIVWKNNLVVFGGSSYYNRKLKHRDVFGTIFYLNVNSMEWFNISSAGEQVEPRR